MMAARSEFTALVGVVVGGNVVAGTVMSGNDVAVGACVVVVIDVTTPRSLPRDPPRANRPKTAAVATKMPMVIRPPRPRAGPPSAEVPARVLMRRGSGVGALACDGDAARGNESDGSKCHQRDVHTVTDRRASVDRRWRFSADLDDLGQEGEGVVGK